MRVKKPFKNQPALVCFSGKGVLLHKSHENKADKENGNDESFSHRASA
jgi:hypothetical protein